MLIKDIDYSFATVILYIGGIFAEISMFKCHAYWHEFAYQPRSMASQMTNNPEKPGFSKKNTVFLLKNTVFQVRNRVSQVKTGFFKGKTGFFRNTRFSLEKQGFSEKPGFSVDNQVNADKPGSS